MKRALCLGLALCSLQAWAQDFASKFMEQCSEEEEVACQTVSPVMMEKITSVVSSSEGEREDAIPGYILSKLKSARIVTSTKDGKKLLERAEQLMEVNQNRFSPLTEDNDSVQKGNLVYVRRHDETILELVMLSLDSANDAFTIVDFTGEMDDRFMEILSQGLCKEEQ